MDYGHLQFILWLLKSTSSSSCFVLHLLEFLANVFSIHVSVLWFMENIHFGRCTSGHMGRLDSNYVRSAHTC